MNKYVDLPWEFESISTESLSIKKAIEFALALESTDYSIPLECGKNEDGREVIVFETEPEVGQSAVNDIRYVERLAVLFDPEDNVSPEVFALRDDFPVVSHLNLKHFEKPKSLCLYEIPYDELKLSWRGVVFLERIREWLNKTSEGILHQADQPLEPFMLDLVGSIILPKDFSEENVLHLYLINEFRGRHTLRAFDKPIPGYEKNGFRYTLLAIETEPQVHGILKKTPRNLHELSELVKGLGRDLIDDLIKPRFEPFLEQSQLHSYRVVILLTIPKKRHKESDVTSIEKISFLSFNSIKEIAIACRFWAEEAGYLSIVLNEHPIHDEVAKIEIGALSTYQIMDKPKAAIYNNLGLDNLNRSCALIGVGSLGSQVFMNLARMGYGKWKIVDDDVLLPHNIARHELDSTSVGFSKVSGMILKVKNLTDTDENLAIQENYLRPVNVDNVTKELATVDTILDASASIAVPRKLAHDNALTARRISLFLNPKGTDLVMLAEDKNRKIRLDQLEVQYYRFIYQNEQLHDHLIDLDGSVRYSTSCRDVSGRIRQDDVATLSGIGAKAFRRVNSEEKAAISIWKTMNTGAVEFLELTPQKFVEFDSNDGWRVSIDKYLIEKILGARKDKLPNETGGVLIGKHDMYRRIIYITESILSPDDSLEYPNAYYRGIVGLKDELAKIEKVTKNQLYYVGEWHSHPNNTSIQQSADDLILFQWISDHMSAIGLPPLMVITGEGGQLGVYT